MRKIGILFLAFITIIGFSCKKEGCTDPDALNYNAEAKKDDGSCTYNLCENNYFRIDALTNGGYLETNASANQVNMLYQVRDEQGKGVDYLTDINRYSLLDYNIEMIGDVEANVIIEPFGTIPTEVFSVMLLDISKSVEGLVPQIKEAAIEFINQSLDDQKIAIWTFDGNYPIKRIDFTTNKPQLIAALNSLPETDLGTSTNLYEALIVGNQQLPNDIYSTSQIRQGNILVFTDGRETANPTESALQNALSAISDRTVFVAALNSPDLDAVTLKQIAGSSGNYFLASNINELKSKFSEIQQDIIKLSKSVYWMHYTSPRKGNTYWNIELKVKGNCNDDYFDSSAKGTYSSQGF